jgi:5-methylcytosine-specific restriction protein A
MFTTGETYKRSSLHEVFGGQRQGGISTPANHKMIFLFTGDNGEQYGYQDGWINNNIFHYTGEGQVGDMTFTRGNLAIQDHVKNDKQLHLFEYVRRGHVRYIGEMQFRGFQIKDGVDANRNARKIIVFELTRVRA